jgi:hypothetical protein
MQCLTSAFCACSVCSVSSGEKVHHCFPFHLPAPNPVLLSSDTTAPCQGPAPFVLRYCVVSVHARTHALKKTCYRLFRGLTSLRQILNALSTALVPVINSCSILLMTTAIYAVIGDIVPVAYGRIPANELLCMCARTLLLTPGDLRNSDGSFQRQV